MYDDLFNGYDSIFGSKRKSLIELGLANRELITPKQLVHAALHEKNEHDKQELQHGYYPTRTLLLNKQTLIWEQSEWSADESPAKHPLELLITPAQYFRTKDLIDWQETDKHEYHIKRSSNLQHITLDDYHALKPQALEIPAHITTQLLGEYGVQDKKFKQAFIEHILEADKQLITDYEKCVFEKTGSDLYDVMRLEADKVSAQWTLLQVHVVNPELDYDGSAAKYRFSGHTERVSNQWYIARK